MGITLKRFYIPFIFFIVIIEATGRDSNDSPSDEHHNLPATGRIVKLYSGTRPEPFLCANDGFQKDPHNCAMFYRCVRTGHGKFIAYRFQCGPGTIYDPDTEVCNHPSSTHRSECGGYLPPIADTTHHVNEIESNNNMYNEIPSPLVSNRPIHTTTVKPPSSFDSMHFSTNRDKTTSSPYPWGSTINNIYVGDGTTTYPINSAGVTMRPLTTLYHEMITPSPVSNNPHENFRDICTSDGFMGDSYNCRKFYRCVANQRGAYTRYEFYCSENTIWDEHYQICNHVWAVRRSRCHSNKISDPNAHYTNDKVHILEMDSQKHHIRDNMLGNTIQQQLQISHGAEVIQTQTQISDGSVEQNQTQINYGNRINPTKDKITKQNQTQISDGSAVSQSQTQLDYGNKAVQTQLQIDHSKEASQSQIQISQSSTKKPLTSTRHYDSTEANQHKNTECTEPGFIGDANDCHKFYRCVDNGQGSYNKIEFKCSEGTAWDPILKTCNHELAVTGCKTQGSPESTTVTTSPNKPTQNYHTTTSTEAYQQIPEAVDTAESEDTGYGYHKPEQTFTSSSTTTLATINVSNGEECTSNGFMGDVNDCKIFYRCVENGNGGFTKHRFQCGEGTVWDANIDACNHAWAVEKCGGGTPSDINKVETTEKVSTSSSTTATSPTQAIPINEYDDNDVPGYGPSNNDIHTTTTTTTIASSKHPPVTSPCKSSGFIGDKHDCTKFYRCVDDGVGGFSYYQFTCSKGTVWDHKKGACDYVENVERCSESYNKPSQDAVSSSPQPSTLNFATSSTESMYADSDKCTQSGFMGDSKNCKKFYRCVDNGDGSYKKYEFMCSDGTLWDPNINNCNHASEVDRRCNHQEAEPLDPPPINDEMDSQYPLNVADSDVSSTALDSHSTTTQNPKKPSEGSSCTSKGYFRDNNNCKKFYRCVDNGNGGFDRYEYTCGEGTVWDPSIKACNHDWAVKDCSMSESTTGSTIMTTTPKDTSNIICAHNDTSSVVCSREGFMGDPNNCKTFYRCVDDGKGGFSKYEYSCGEGTYWNQDITSCDHITSDKECGDQGTISTSKEPQHLNDETNIETTTVSRDNHHQEPTQKPMSSPDICKTEGFYGDKNDCRKFYRCVDDGQGGYTQYYFNCGEGTVWDQEILSCNHESDTKCSSSTSSSSQPPGNHTQSGDAASTTTTTTTTPTTENYTTANSISEKQCESEGLYADPNNCKKFIRCVKNEKGGFTKYEFACAEGTVWVQEMLTCYHDTGEAYCSQTTLKTSTASQQTTEKYDSSTLKPSTPDKANDDSDSKPGTDSCSSEGYHPNSNDCTKFYRCVDNSKGGYTKYDLTCSEGTAWDSSLNTCNYIEQVPSCQGTVMHDEDNTQTTQKADTSSQESVTKTTTTTTQKPTTTSESSSDSSSQNTDTCNSEGFFGNTKDCKKFYRCVDNGKGGYTKYDFICAEGTIWDADVTTCNHPQDVVNPSCNQKHDDNTTESSSPSESTSGTSESNQGPSGASKEPENINCTKAGFYPNPNDCKKFYRCVDWDGNGTRFSVYHFTCGEGTIWDPAVETCNHEESVYPPRNCNGSQSQPSATEGTTTTTEKGSTTESTTESTTQSTTESISSESGEQSSSTESTSTTAELTTEGTTEKSTEGTTEKSTEGTTEKSTHGTTEKSTEGTTESTAETSSESTSTEQSTTSEKSTEGTTEKSTEGSTEGTSEKSTEALTEGTTEKSTEGTTEHTTEKSTESTTEGIPEISTEGTTEGTTEKSTEGTTEGTTEKSTEGTTEGTTEKSTEGTTEGTTEKSTEGTTEGIPEISTEGTTEGTTEKSTEGTTEGTTEKSTEGTTEGTTEKSTEGTTEGTTEKSTEGTTEGTTEKSTEGTTEGTTEQSPEGVTQQSGEGTTEQSGETTTEHSGENTTPKENGPTTEEGEEKPSEGECPETDDDQYMYVCPSSFRRHPKYCNLFYQCDENEETHDIKVAVFTCPNNTIYDESQTKCVEESKADKECEGEIAQKRRVKRKDSIGNNMNGPIVATKSSYACRTSGYYSFEKDGDCSPAFLKCKRSKSNHIMRGFVYKCPAGFLFWSVSRRCEPISKISDCRRSYTNEWSRRWEIPIERKNVAKS